MAEKTIIYIAEVQRIYRSENFEDYRGSTFAKFSLRGLLSSSLSRRCYENLWSVIALMMNRPENPSRPYCQLMQRLISLSVRVFSLDLWYITEQCSTI